MSRFLIRSAAPLALVLALAGCAQPSQPATTPPDSPPATAEPTVEPSDGPAEAEPGESRVPIECAELVAGDFLTGSFGDAMTEVPRSEAGSPASAAVDQAGTLTCGWRGGETDDAGFYRDALYVSVLTDAAFDVPTGDGTVDSGFGTRFDTFAEESAVECTGGETGFGCEVDGIVGRYWFSARIDSGRQVPTVEEALDAADRFGADVAAALETAEPLARYLPASSDLPGKCEDLDPEGAIPAAFPEAQLGDPSTPGGDGYGRAAYQAWTQVGFLNCGWHSDATGFLQLNALPGGDWAWNADAIAAEGRADATPAEVPGAAEAVSLCRELSEGTFACGVHFTGANDLFSTSAVADDRDVAANRALRIATAWASAYLG